MANMSGFRLKELLAAPFTPLLPDREINFPLIKDYVDYLVKAHFTGIFINGSLAEGMSMTLDERKRLAVAWKEASNGRLQLVVHVGANAIKDAQELARHAEELGADAIAAFAPSYYKPENEVNVRKFLELAKDRIPTLCGIKHSSRSLPSAHDCTLIENGHMQVLMGTNEQYLSVLTLGMPGTVIVSYLGPLFYELRKAFDAGDLKTAREKQILCQKVQNIRNKYGGGMSAAKSVFKVLTGIDVGSVRLPLRQLGAPEISKGGMSAAKSVFKVLTGIDVGPVRLPLRQLGAQETENMRLDFKDAGLANVALPDEE